MPITPQYIAEKSAEIRNELWWVIRHFFQTRHPDCYDYDEEAQAVYLKPNIDAPLLYYANQRAYYSNKKYGLAPNFKPESCRITLISDVGYNIFFSAKCMNHGEIKVDDDIEPCEISLFSVELRTEKTSGMRSPWMRKGTYLKTYNFLYGKTASGRILSEDECRKILWLPVIECQESGEQVRYAYDIGSNKLSVAKIPELEQEIINRYLNEIRTSVKEDAVLAKLKAERKKSKLDEQLADMRSDLKKAREALSTINNPLEELKAKKQINSMDRELKQREEGLFLEQLKIDAEMEAEIDDLLDKKKLFCDFYRMFKISVVS